MKKLKGFIYFVLNGESKNYKDLKKYKDKMENEDIDCVVEKMALDYFKMNIEEKQLFELELKDKINEIDKFSFISLTFVFITPVLSFILSEQKLLLIICCFILYISIGRTISKVINSYRCCKLYLNVILKIQENKIIEIEVPVKKIKYVE
ncbi:hypothetical protein FDB88_11965 [Clostridium sporogenes]|uniref:hypothetical protein n=1 Tax=Clostridium sporogenes TaxID=1509 RepID=UPI0013D2FE50|nr:hypothetical protein [Clostridium sporogenes]NFM17903.1 hypothetical protein [Clostridium sporogenes]